MRRRRILNLLIVVALLAVGVVGWMLFSRPTFDPRVVGRAEARMWQGYYAGNHAQVALQLVRLLRTQYGLSTLQSTRVGERFADAAMTFKSARADYEATVLPELVEAYTALAGAAGTTFDPEEVAQAELAWWVARRTVGEGSAENVGAKIGELYAAVHGGDHPAYREAGLLRARAAHLRDRGGENADWEEIEALLVRSYTVLAEAL